MTPEEKRREEEKRDRRWTPAERFRYLQDAITFAEANMRPEFRRNVPRVHPGTRLTQASPLSSKSPSSQPK
jgi:hypothetical protein